MDKGGPKRLNSELQPTLGSIFPAKAASSDDKNARYIPMRCVFYRPFADFSLRCLALAAKNVPNDSRMSTRGDGPKQRPSPRPVSCAGMLLARGCVRAEKGPIRGVHTRRHRTQTAFEVIVRHRSHASLTCGRDKRVERPSGGGRWLVRTAAFSTVRERAKVEVSFTAKRPPHGFSCSCCFCGAAVQNTIKTIPRNRVRIRGWLCGR